MMPLCIGIDTSNYTTSIACVCNGSVLFDKRTVLSVDAGHRGLRQSEALFQHNRNLPSLIRALFENIDSKQVKAVGVSATPTDRENSYMPVFLAGKLAAESIADALGVSMSETTHQYGHIRAALLGNEPLMRCERFLSVHLSGGTTDLLMTNVSPTGKISVDPLGSSSDLHAGQFVDRVAVAMGTPFPGGPHLEQLALQANEKQIRIPSSVRKLKISFSGAESFAARCMDSVKPAELAWGVYDCLARTLAKWLLNAAQYAGCSTVLISGGVASSALLRSLLKERIEGKLEIRYGEPRYSSDNAVGIALIADDILRREYGNE